jgi:hypothetical protein
VQDVSLPEQVSTPEQSEQEGDEDEVEGEDGLLGLLVGKTRHLDATNEAMRERVDAEILAGVMANGVTPNPHLSSIHTSASTPQHPHLEHPHLKILIVRFGGSVAVRRACKYTFLHFAVNDAHLNTICGMHTCLVHIESALIVNKKVHEKPLVTTYGPA